MKGPLLQSTVGEYVIKLSVLKFCLRDDLETDTFRISHAFLFQVFNARDNLKATRATHWSLGLNENFSELKSGDKS